MKKILVFALCVTCFNQVAGQKFNFQPDKKHLVSISVGIFFDSHGSILTPTVSTQYLFGGMFQFGYEYRQEPNGVFKSHGGKFTIFPITSELLKIGFGYSPVWITHNPELHELFYNRGSLESLSPDEQQVSAEKYEERHFLHGFRIDFSIRVSEKIEISGGPMLGLIEFNGGTVALTYRL